MNAYYIRHSMNPETDIARGFSAVGCFILGRTEETALVALAEMHGIDAEEQPREFARFCDEHEVMYHDDLGGWVEPHSGLCAHAVFNTLEEALEAARAGEVVFLADGGMRDMGELYVFEGRPTAEDVMFDPTGAYWKV